MKMFFRWFLNGTPFWCFIAGWFMALSIISIFQANYIFASAYFLVMILYLQFAYSKRKI